MASRCGVRSTSQRLVNVAWMTTAPGRLPQERVLFSSSPSVASGRGDFARVGNEQSFGVELDSRELGLPSHARSQGTASVRDRQRAADAAMVGTGARSCVERQAKWHPSRDHGNNAVAKAESCSIGLLTNHASPESQYIATDPDASSPRCPAVPANPGSNLTPGVLGSARPNRPPIPSSTSAPKSLGRPVRWAIGLLALWKD